MRLSAIAAGLAAAMVAGAASAHPGANLLTTGGKGAAAAMGGGVRFEEVNGVHVFRGGGRTAEPESELLGGAAALPAIERDIVIRHRPFRHIRHLRTQGFYSGVPYPSRRYTQGFYSSGR